MSSKHARNALVWSALTLAATPAAQAQNLPPAAELEEVTVTASRVERGGFSAPTPTQVLDAADLERKGAVNVIDALNQLPAFRPSSTLTTNTVAVEGRGQLFADLRGLGASRTLVLVDGRRSTPTNSKGQVDLNFVPTILVARTEVVTGGASAAWGSDAVAGVVNMLLKKDLQGVLTDFQYGSSDKGDDTGYKAAFAAGSSFADGRGRVLIGADYSDNDGVGDIYERDWGREERGTLANAAHAINGMPATIYARNVRLATAAPGGVITGGPLRGRAFGPGGVPYDFNYGQVFGNAMIGGEGDVLSQGIFLKVPVERVAALGHIGYDFTDGIAGFLQVSYGNNENAAPGAPVGRDQGTLTISIENPYLPQSVRDEMTGLGLQSVPFGRNSTDMGMATYRNENETSSATLGLSGRLGSGWKWDAYAQYGENQYDQIVSNNRIEPNWRRAIDPVLHPDTGEIVCRSTLTNPADGCVPINLFGVGSPSAEAIDYVTGTSFYTQETTQTVAAVNLSGDAFSTWAGPVSVAAGLEYREQTISGSSDPISLARDFRFGNPQPISGRVEVQEGYVEFVAPLVNDATWARSIELNGAARYTDYSTSGGVTTWKAGLSYAVNAQLRFRATQSRDIRAPNAAELFTSSTSATTGIRNPATGELLQTHVDSSGNLALEPEEADTFTAGVVYQPDWQSSLRLSIDYYDIDITGQISSLHPQMIVDRCFAGANDLCNLVIRDATGRILKVVTPQLNLDRFQTRGVDLEAAYSFALASLFSSAGGDVSLRILGNFVQDFIKEDSAGAVDRAGETGGVGVPDWTATAMLAYSLGGFSMSGHWRYIASGTVDNTTTPTGTNSRNVNTVPSMLYTDLAMQYELPTESRMSTQLYAAVDNVFDEDPPFPIGGIFASNGIYYDVIGRTFRVGVRVRY